MGNGLRLESWWDEPAYKAAQGTFSERDAFILAHDHAAARLVLADVYRNGPPDPSDITRFESETTLRFMGADAE